MLIDDLEILNNHPHFNNVKYTINRILNIPFVSPTIYVTYESLDDDFKNIVKQKILNDIIKNNLTSAKVSFSISYGTSVPRSEKYLFFYRKVIYVVCNLIPLYEVLVELHLNRKFILITHDYGIEVSFIQDSPE